MHKLAFSVLLVFFTLGFNAPGQAPNGILASQEPDQVPQEKKPDTVPSQSQQPGQAADNAKVELTDGTPIRLKFVRAVVSSQVIAGDKVALEVVESVLAGKLVAIPQHTSAEAMVTMAQAGRTMGRGGNLQLKIEGIRLADGEVVPVRAVKDTKGGNQPLAQVGEAGMAAGFVFWPATPLGFLVYARGKSARIPAGAEITAYITGDFPLDPSKFQPPATNPQEKNEPK